MVDLLVSKSVVFFHYVGGFGGLDSNSWRKIARSLGMVTV